MPVKEIANDPSSPYEILVDAELENSALAFASRGLAQISTNPGRAAFWLRSASKLCSILHDHQILQAEETEDAAAAAEVQGPRGNGSDE